MTKGKALWMGSVFTVITVVALFNYLAAAIWFAIPALLFMGIWFYKFQRDQSIVAKGKQERLRATQAPLPKPPITSPSSKGIFLPEPLNNNSRKNSPNH